MDFDSTLIRRARTAVTFTDMADFASELDTRPIIKLLDELPELARLSETKFVLATRVLRRRFEEETTVDQVQLQSIADEIAANVLDADTSARIRRIFRPASEDTTWGRHNHS